MRSFLLAVHGVLGSDVSGQKCDSRPIAPEVEEWCERSCTQLLAFLRMRAPFQSIDMNIFNAAEAMHTWSSCPTAHRGLLLARVAHRLRTLPENRQGMHVARNLLISAEHVARAYVMDINLTGYLTSGVSYAPWFHIGSVYDVIRQKYPEILEAEDEAKDALDHGPLREALELYLSQDAPVSGIERGRPQGRYWSLAMACRSFARADFLRLTACPGIVGNGGPGAWEERLQMERLMNLGQRYLQQAYLHTKARAAASWTDMFGLIMMVDAARLPLFDLLDRLDSQVIEAIHLRQSVTHRDTGFYVHLLPTRNVESNHVRSVLELHCDKVFKDLVSQWRPSSVVEVGTHLGGCILHALTHSQEAARARGVAIDAYGPAVTALRRTAESNGLGPRLKVRQHFVCEERDERRFDLVFDETGVLSQPGWREAMTANGSESMACTSLDTILEEEGMDQVDLLRVSVLGREFDALRSAKRLLKEGRARVVAASVLRDNKAPAEMAEMLLGYGYKLYFDGSEDEDVVRIFSDRSLIPEGTLTLVAERKQFELVWEVQVGAWGGPARPYAKPSAPVKLRICRPLQAFGAPEAPLELRPELLEALDAWRCKAQSEPLQGPAHRAMLAIAQLVPSEPSELDALGTCASSEEASDGTWFREDFEDLMRFYVGHLEGELSFVRMVPEDGLTCQLWNASSRMDAARLVNEKEVWLPELEHPEEHFGMWLLAILSWNPEGRCRVVLDQAVESNEFYTLGRQLPTDPQQLLSRLASVTYEQHPGVVGKGFQAARSSLSASPAVSPSPRAAARDAASAERLVTQLAAAMLGALAPRFGSEAKSARRATSSSICLS
ncbi:unnamed protein product [Effrenium voratum]|nr:unnamed protein product [Effrenium voratum]